MHSPHSRTPRSTRLVGARGAAVVAGGTGLYLRAALADLEVPPPGDPRARQRIEREVDADRAAAHRRLSQVDPASAEAVHPNDLQRLVRALELAETGRSLVDGQARLWSGVTRRPTLICGLAVSSDVLERRIRERADAMFEDGVVAEVRAALGKPLSRTAVKALGLSDIAELEPAEALERIVVRTRRYAAYQRKWMRRIPGSSRSTASGRRARWQTRSSRWRSGSLRAMRFEKWHALGNAYLVVERQDAGALTPARVRRLCDGAHGHRLGRGPGGHPARRRTCRGGRLEPGRLRGGDVRERRPDRGMRGSPRERGSPMS